MFKRILLIPIMLSLSACASANYKDFHAEGALASGFCVRGDALLYGGGTVVGIKLNEGFYGTIQVSPDCQVQIGAERP
jgi:hypothetical protein